MRPRGHGSDTRHSLSRVVMAPKARNCTLTPLYQKGRSYKISHYETCTLQPWPELEVQEQGYVLWTRRPYLYIIVYIALPRSPHRVPGSTVYVDITPTAGYRGTNDPQRTSGSIARIFACVALMTSTRRNAPTQSRPTTTVSVAHHDGPLTTLNARP